MFILMLHGMFDSVLSLSLVQHFVTSVLKVLTVDLPVALIYSYSIKEHACYSSCLFYLELVAHIVVISFMTI